MRAWLTTLLMSSMVLTLPACSESRADQGRAQLPDLPKAPVKKPYVAPLNLKPSEPEVSARSPSTREAGVQRLLGSTAARRRSQIAPAGSGMVQEVLVKEGQIVEAGAVLARLDARVARLQLDQATAAVQGAQAQLAGAEREVKRLAPLVAKDAIARAELERAETARDGARAQVAAHRASQGLAKRNLEEMTIRAPFGGLVTRRFAEVGQWISMMPPSPIAEIVELDPLELRIEVPEALLHEVHEGQTVKAFLPALSKRVEATIVRVVRDINPMNRAFTVIAELPNPDGQLPAGAFAEVSLSGGATP